MRNTVSLSIYYKVLHNSERWRFITFWAYSSYSMNSFLESERFICWRLLYFYFWQRKEQLQAAFGEPTLLICQANDFTISDNMTHQLIVGQSIAPCKWNKYTSSSKPVSFIEANNFWAGRTGVWSKPLGIGKEMQDLMGSSKREGAEERFYCFFRFYRDS